MAFTSVNITVMDVNDNSPRFDQEVYNIYTPEDSPLDSVVFVAQVSERTIGLFHMKPIIVYA